MIEFKGLVKKFGKVEVLNKLDLIIEQEGIFAILGPNGSGKTTLIKSLLGMVVPNKGDITINGLAVRNQYDYRNNINYLPQIANFPGNLSVKELIKMIRDIRMKPANDAELIELFGLSSDLDKKLAHLSGGTKQKVNLVLTFMFDSDLIILDEPTSGLDPVSAWALDELIVNLKQSLDLTVVIITHDLDSLWAITDRVAVLANQRVFAVTPINELIKFEHSWIQNYFHGPRGRAAKHNHSL